MPEIQRVTRASYMGARDRDDYSSDDDRSIQSRSRHGGGTYRTVQRYRVGPSHQASRNADLDETRSVRTVLAPRNNDRSIEIDRRIERFTEPERPRSSIDIRPRTVADKTWEREPAREPEREHTRTLVYERDRPREPEPMSPWDRPRNDRPWENNRDRDVRESEMRIEKRVERRDDPWDRDRERETDMRIEKRVERRDDSRWGGDRESEFRIEKRTERHDSPRRDDSGYEIERYQRETEYYDRPDPAPQPIIIRQQAPKPQQIIVQEAPTQPPVVIPQQQEKGFEVIRRAEIQQEVGRPRDEEYYYRRDVRDVGRPREDDYAVEKYDRRKERDYNDDEDVIVTKKVVKRDRSLSESHHKRHLAEGALAGAGIAALVGNHREKQSGTPVHRGRNLAGGAALGALTSEIVTRARSRYRDPQDEKSRSRSRSKSPDSRNKLKTAVGIAALGLAAAGLAKYTSGRNAAKEEDSRGRARTRSVSRRRSSIGGYIDDDDERPRSRSKAAQMAKAGAATAALTGVVEHFRNKSKKRDGSRSKSRLRTGAEIAAAGLGGAAIAGLYENRKAKEDKDAEAERLKRDRRRVAKSRSRSRARSVGYSDAAIDPELGMVQYGTDPVYAHQHPQEAYDPRYDDYEPYATPAAGAPPEAAYGANRSPRRSESRTRRRRHSSSSEDVPHEETPRVPNRSRSRVRDIAGGAFATGAAAIGIDQYKKRRRRREREAELERERERERDRRRYEEEDPPPENYYAANDDYSDDGYSPSPPHASGGSYYPASANFPPPPTPSSTAFTHHDNQSSPHVNEIPVQAPIPPYNPADYAGQPPTPTPPDFYGHDPPHRGDNVSPIDESSGLNDHHPPHRPGSPAVSTSSTSDPISDSTNLAYLNARSSQPPPIPQPRPPSPVQIPSSPISERAANKSVTWAPVLAASQPSTTPSPDLGEDSSSSSASTITAAHQSHHPPRRRSSDPSSNRPRNRRHHAPNSESFTDSDSTDTEPNHRNQQVQRRNQSRSRSRSHSSRRQADSPSTTSSIIEELPPRFDHDGRLLPRSGYPSARNSLNLNNPDDMVQRVVRHFGEVVEGRRTWREMLGGVLEGLQGPQESEDTEDNRGTGERERSRDREDRGDRHAENRRRRRRVREVEEEEETAETENSVIVEDGGSGKGKGKGKGKGRWWKRARRFGR